MSESEDAVHQACMNSSLPGPESGSTKSMSLLHHDPQDGFVLDADVQEIEPATEGVGWMILAIPRDPEDPRAGQLRSS
jgi:hypothetical protein